MKSSLPFRHTRKYCGLSQFFATIFSLIVGTTTSWSSIYTINMESGTSGTVFGGQSYNETRAVDVTVLSALNLSVSSMTLSGINGTGTAEAVIYNSNTQALIASATGTLTGGTITLPISATLVPGGDYRIGFYGLLGSGTEFEPNGWTLSHETPYTESNGLLQINSAWDLANNAFPTNPNLFVPEITMQVTSVPEPGTPALAGLGLLLSLLFYKRTWKRQIAIQ